MSQIIIHLFDSYEAMLNAEGLSHGDICKDTSTNTYWIYISEDDNGYPLANPTFVQENPSKITWEAYVDGAINTVRSEFKADDAVLSERIDNTNSFIRGVSDDVTTLGDAVRGLNSKLDADELFESIKPQADAEYARKDDTFTKSEVYTRADIDQKFHELPDKYVRRGDLDIHKATIDGSITSISTQINQLSREVGEVASSIDDYETSISVLGDEIGEVRDEIKSIQDQIENIEIPGGVEGDFVERSEFNEAINNVTNRVTSTELSVNSLNTNKLSKEDASITYATKDELAAAKEDVIDTTGKQIARLEAGLYATVPTKDEVTAEIATLGNAIEATYATKEELATVSDELSAIEDVAATKEELATAIETTKGEFNEAIEEAKEEVKRAPNVYKPGAYVPTDSYVGTNIPVYKGKTYEEIWNNGDGITYTKFLDDILFEVVEPEFVEPTSTINLQPLQEYFTQEEVNGAIALREVGSAGPSSSIFNFDCTRGEVITAQGTQPWTGLPAREGDENDGDLVSELICYYNGEKIENEGPVKLGKQEYKYRVYFLEGIIPTNNVGQELDKRWPRRKPVDSDNSIVFYGTMPWFASTEKTEDGALTKQPLVLWDDEQMEVYGELLPTCMMPQSISIPRELKGWYIEQMGAWVKAPMSKLHEPVIENGYYTYTYNHEEFGHRGRVKIKVVF